jgi:hypothetical protein
MRRRGSNQGTAVGVAITTILIAALSYFFPGFDGLIS